MRLSSYAEGFWHTAVQAGQPLFHAVTGDTVAEISSEGLDFRKMLDFARQTGGPQLRRMTIHARARMVKALALYINSRKDELYEISRWTGATKTDSWIDIEGGTGTALVFASKGRRELPDQGFHLDGDVEQLSKGGTFVGRHLCVPLEGVAIHINAFNFPVWGALEKMAPSLIAGMPVIIKPASTTAYLAAKLAQLIVASKLLPTGAFQIICGGVGDLLDHLTCQDVVTFTGSAATGFKLRTHKTLVENSIRFNMEADSLNCSILGPDAQPGSPEFDLFVKEVAREMTVKAGQKCTAIRRTIVPQGVLEPVVDALRKRLGSVTLGDPAVDGVRMGPLAARSQVKEVGARVAELEHAGELVFGNLQDFTVTGADRDKGAFFPPLLLHCAAPLQHAEPHTVEAFGPVSTVMPYRDVAEAIELARRGKGSLCGSIFTADNAVAREITHGLAPLHGRLLVINAHCAAESTGHGSPLAHLVHGGPGRAGGGEELGGIRSVLHYMQRTAIQGSPTTLTAITDEFTKGSALIEDRIHPFRKFFDELQIGETLITHRRTLTEADVVNFAGISGDTFYAHTDEIAARDSLFGQRVAHGYLVLAAAAGLFVHPAPGPVLANYGLERLRFIKPVNIGDTIRVRLTCKSKTAKEPREGDVPQGVVAWDVEVSNQNNEAVAVYTILTLVARKAGATVS
jgi:oxepin-CoA hydrolase/3-oxo-5,6-dehydrosuberyl-CoA semialdehyde dehydrogenase